MFFYAAIIISIIGLLIATYTDLKERIVTNKLNFTLAITGLAIYLAQTIMTQNPTPIILSFLGLIIGFTFGWTLWKMGVFAGGDVKLFMALGALNPLTPALLKAPLLTNSTLQIFPITLFLYALIGFLPYGLIIVIYKLSKNKKFQTQLKNEAKKRIIDGAKIALLIGSISTILLYLQIPTIVIIPLLIILGFIKKQKIITLIIIVTLLVALIISLIPTIQIILLTFIFITFFYGTIKLMLSLKPLLETEVLVKNLEEGMIPAKTLYWEKNKVKEYSFSIKQLLLDKSKDKFEKLLKPRKEIISSMKARGLTEEEIRELKKLYKNKLIPKTIKIKESMPFVPTMLIGYILCLIIGDFWIFLW